MFGFFLKLEKKKFFADWFQGVFREYEQRSKSGDVSDEFLHLNAEIHAISCASKPISTWYAFRAINESRKACGGHGFSNFSHLPILREYHDPFQTFEGDNNVLLQQVERWLLKPDVESPLGSTKMFKRTSHAFDPQKRVVDQIQTLLDFRAQVFLFFDLFKFFHSCFQYLLEQSNAEVMGSMGKFDGKGNFKDFAWNTWNKLQASAPLQALAKAFIENFVFQTASEIISHAPASIRHVLEDVQALFGLQLLTEDLATLLESHCVDSEGSKMLKAEFVRLCGEVKKEALGLVDAYAPPDLFVQSALGKSDGRIYTNIWNHLQQDKSMTYGRAAYWADLRPVQQKDDLIKRVVSKSKL